ncbi:DNA topoisomerase (plasmid) [Fructilactobacillus vespulae]|uniref:type IA DNA topoisomerase n=1 Tax=Fructilactobacillus vespulae TaxID=1249630 RepID=UPI0039B5A4D1
MTLVVLTEKGEQLKPFALANDPNAKKISASKWTAHSNILNDDLVFVCASGHLFSLDNPDDYDSKYEKWNLSDLPIMIDNFNYHLSSGRNTKFFKQIKDEVKKAEGVILATDPDQEGELIGRLILEKIPNGLQKLKYRLWNSSMTIGASKKAFENLLDPKKHELLKVSGESRQFADWLVGMNLTRMATINLQSKGYRGVFSVGRVQTPALAIVVANDEAIANFKPQDYYQLEARTQVEGAEFNLINAKKYLDQGEANDNLNGVVSGTLVRSNYLDIVKIEKSHHKVTAPKLFVLSDVQGKAAKEYGFSADKVMNLIESMYLHGFTSYTRPDSHFINLDEFNLIKEHVSEYQELIDFKFEPVFLEPRKAFVKDAEKIGGHSALEPTEKLPKRADLSEDEWKIYKLIVERVLLMFAPDFEYDETKIIAKDNNGNEFHRTGRLVTSEGWRALTNNVPKGNEVPKLNEGDRLPADFGLLKKTTTVPKRITESTLIGTILPKYNLGTQATRAGIIKELKETRKYIKINRKKEVFPTDQGRLIYQFMKETIFTKPLMTAEWDKELVDISKGKESGIQFLSVIKKTIIDTLNEYQTTQPNLTIAPPEKSESKVEETENQILCPRCKKGYLEKVSGISAKKQKYIFYRCDSKICKFRIRGMFSGKELSEKTIEEIVTDKVSGVLTFTNKKGETYKARFKLKNSELEPEFIK